MYGNFISKMLNEKFRVFNSRQKTSQSANKYLLEYINKNETRIPIQASAIQISAALNIEPIIIIVYIIIFLSVGFAFHVYQHALSSDLNLMRLINPQRL